MHKVISTKQETMLCRKKDYNRVIFKILPGPLAPGSTLPSRNMTALSYSCTIYEKEKVLICKPLRAWVHFAFSMRCVFIHRQTTG